VLTKTTFEYLLRFEGDDLICERRTDPGTFQVIYRIADACAGCDVDVCDEEIEWCQLYAEEDYGGPLPWRYVHESQWPLLCRTDELCQWTRSS
jgi:hypothetical protein